MNHRKHLFRKLDPLLILAFLVGVGVILTTTVQARSPNDGAKAPRSWFARIVDNLDSVLSDSGDGLRAGAGGAPVPAREGFSWHVQAVPDQSPTANAVQPEVRFGVTYNW